MKNFLFIFLTLLGLNGLFLSPSMASAEPNTYEDLAHVPSSRLQPQVEFSSPSFCKGAVKTLGAVGLAVGLYYLSDSEFWVAGSKALTDLILLHPSNLDDFQSAWCYDLNYPLSKLQSVSCIFQVYFQNAGLVVLGGLGWESLNGFS